MVDDRSVRGYVGELARDGIVADEDFLDPDQAEQLREAADGVLAEEGVADDPGITEIPDAHERSDFLDELRDSFYVEAIVNGYTEAFYTADDLVLRVGTGPTDPEPYRTVGEGVFLAVVYLTDASEVADGPYAYMHGSHRESTLKRGIGSVLGSVSGMGAGDATFFAESDGRAHTGSAGTLLVAHGRGYQRFLPVGDGRRSMTAVIRFTESPEQSRPKYGDPETGSRNRQEADVPERGGPGLRDRL